MHPWYSHQSSFGSTSFSSPFHDLGWATMLDVIDAMVVLLYDDKGFKQII